VRSGLEPLPWAVPYRFGQQNESQNIQIDALGFKKSLKDLVAKQTGVLVGNIRPNCGCLFVFVGHGKQQILKNGRLYIDQANCQQSGNRNQVIAARWFYGPPQLRAGGAKPGQ
jgi:hypothetical protein